MRKNVRTRTKPKIFSSKIGTKFKLLKCIIASKFAHSSNMRSDAKTNAFQSNKNASQP